jgi:hypothetical protein
MNTLFYHWKTTFVGFALIGAGIYSGVSQKADWKDSAVIITMGIGLLFASDGKTPGANGTAVL